MLNVLTRITVGVMFVGVLSACGPAGEEKVASSDATTDSGRNEVAAASPAVPEPAAFAGGMVTQMPAAGNCALDILNGASVTSTLTVKRTDQVTLGGWMANSAGQVPTDARLVLQSTAKSYMFPVIGGVSREDVAGVMKNEALKTAGFELPLGLSGAQVGAYELAIVMGGDSTPIYACPLGIKLVITD